jgi:hypothetical protein
MQSTGVAQAQTNYMQNALMAQQQPVYSQMAPAGTVANQPVQHQGMMMESGQAIVRA